MMNEIEASLLKTAGLRIISESDESFAPSALAERFLHCRVQSQSQITGQIIGENLTLWISEAKKGFPELQFGIIHFSAGQLWQACSYQQVFDRFSTPGYLIKGSEYLQSIEDSEYLQPNLHSDIHSCAYQVPMLGEGHQFEWHDDPQGIVAPSSLGLSIGRLKTQKLALVLLKELSPNEADVDLERIFEKEGVSDVAAAAGFLVQIGAAIVEGNKLRLTHEGLRMLQLNRKARVHSRLVSRSRSWRKGLFFSGLFATLGAIALASKQAVKRVTLGTSYREDPIDNSVRNQLTNKRSEVEDDPNYRAYLGDLAELQEKYDKCVVAYANGALVAVGNDIGDLERKIPSEYWKQRLLIKDIPEKPLKVRPRLRVAS
jgi:hypothetical protein